MSICSIVLTSCLKLGVVQTLKCTEHFYKNDIFKLIETEVNQRSIKETVNQRKIKRNCLLTGDKRLT